jgi:hypothetical protein
MISQRSGNRRRYPSLHISLGTGILFMDYVMVLFHYQNCIVSDGRMIGELQKDLKKSGHGICLKGLRKTVKASLMIVGVLPEIKMSTS